MVSLDACAGDRRTSPGPTGRAGSPRTPTHRKARAARAGACRHGRRPSARSGPRVEDCDHTSHRCRTSPAARQGSRRTHCAATAAVPGTVRRPHTLPGGAGRRSSLLPKSVVHLRRQRGRAGIPEDSGRRTPSPWRRCTSATPRMSPVRSPAVGRGVPVVGGQAVSVAWEALQGTDQAADRQRFPSLAIARARAVLIAVISVSTSYDP
jgi:hypothetical protein